ncbi:MarR family transcriptional regulator [Methanobrevibacter sp.]|uniref:MarR family transcriptional regulator n=1 Tax=Methanobrevibacter sp. TaxID=66852 RepID=UPI003890DBFD
MPQKVNEEEIWELIGFIKVSPTRYKTLKTLRTDFLMPSEIAKTTGLRTTQVSNALADLKEKDLVICMNESARKGRLYQNTELGLEILQRLER